MAKGTETIKVLDIQVDGAVKSIGDLKNNIKELKKQLEEQEIGSEKYQETLNELKLNQNALKDAMYATSASMEDLRQSASGAGESYNSLVHRMSALKEELRNVDVSTEEGKKRFSELAGQINNVNDKLKAMDAQQGNHQRNVGNYKSALDGLASKFSAVAGNASSVINPVANVTKGLGVLSATPVIGILGLLANVLTQVIGHMNSSADSTNRLTTALSIFSPIGDTITKVMQSLGKAVAWVAEKFSAVYEAVFGLSDAQQERKRLAEEGIELEAMEREAIKRNADDRLKIAQLREKSTAKEKYSAKERLAFMEEANAMEEDILKRQLETLEKRYNMIKDQNALTESSEADLKKEADAYAAMMDAQTQYYNKVSSNNERLNALRNESAAASKSVIKAEQEVVKENALSLDNILKNIATTEKELDKDRADRLQETKELSEMTESMWLETNQSIDEMFEEMHQNELRRMQEEIDMAQRTAEAKIETLFTVASATSSIMSSIADLYEQDGENNKKSAQKAKNIRIASATIDTISGAVAAFMQYQKQGIPQPYASILGAAQAAAVTAAGMAQIAKIKSTSFSGSSSSAGGSMNASVSAPSIGTEITPTRNVTSASEEARLNQMASEQRVVLVMSDLETKQGQIKVQTEESSF